MASQPRVAVVSVALAVIAVGCRRTGAHGVPLAAEALSSVQADRAEPVGKDLLAQNPLRRTAGLAEVAEGWLTAPTSLVVLDGPSIAIVLDQARQPVKVIERWGLRGAQAASVREYAVSRGRLTGRGARWFGSPPALQQTETFRDGLRDGPVEIFDREGRRIASCAFRRGRPWDGVTVERNGFDPPVWKVSYSAGKQDGEEVHALPDGSPERVRTFREGVQHGSERFYREGRLQGELWWWEGEILEGGREAFEARRAGR